jgi:hypothetical protein
MARAIEGRSNLRMQLRRSLTAALLSATVACHSSDPGITETDGGATRSADGAHASSSRTKLTSSSSSRRTQESSAGKSSTARSSSTQSGHTSGGDPLAPSRAPPLDTNPADYPANVWVTDGMVKVSPTATPGSTHWAELYAAKNEAESFQVHVQAPSSGPRGVSLSVRVSDLEDAVSGSKISASTNVSVFREAYLDITTLSDQNGTLGATPDPLIPTVDAYAHEARTAFPVMVPAGQTQSVWVDVLVPPSAPSGYYTGKVTVTNGTTTMATLPVQLAVWDFALPSTSSLRSGFGLGWNSLCVQAYGGYSSCGSYPGATSPDDAVEKIHVSSATLFLDYRVSLGSVVYAPVTDGDFTHFDSVYGGLLGGTAATTLVGAELTGIWFAGSTTNAMELSTWQQHFAAMPHWTALAPAYYCDEPPNGCSWADALSEADAIHEDAPGMLTLLTTDYANAQMNGLLGAVDILTSIVNEMEPAGAPSARPGYDGWLKMPDKHLWWYQSCESHEACTDGTPGPASSTWPSYMVDASPVRNRVFQWLAYLDQIEGELYYATDYCWTTPCGDAASGSTSDPWVSVYAFGGNGDGTLVYPGTAAKIGGTTPVTVPSVRLALLRDGMEDFEYLHALDDAGDGAFATSTARAFITSATEYSTDPGAMQSARRALGTRLHQLALH